MLPYTTLFRSVGVGVGRNQDVVISAQAANVDVGCVFFVLECTGSWELGQGRGIEVLDVIGHDVGRDDGAADRGAGEDAGVEAANDADVAGDAGDSALAD